MQQQFNGGTVKEQRIKALIIQYDDSIRYQKKLLDCYLAEKLHSFIPLCMNDDEELKTQLQEKTVECDRLKLSLELAEERVPKFHLKYLQNTAMKEFLDFAIYLSTFRDSDEDVGSTSKTEKEKLFQYSGISSDIYHDKELNKDEQGAGSRSGEVTDRGTFSTLPANVINEDLLTLNSKLELAQESLDAEKEHSSQLQSERDSLDHLSEKLCRLLFEYQKRIGIHAEKMKTRDEPSNDKDRPNIKAVCDSSLITRRPSLQSDIECSIEKLKPSPSQNVKGNRLHRKDIDSVSMVSKASDRKQEKHFRKPILATRLTNNENIKKNDKSTNVGIISRKTGENKILFDERCARLQCAHCDKRCSQKAELISHIHSHHISLVAKQFKCTMCDKSFSWRNSLKRHQLLHGTQRLFECSACDLSFKYQTSKTRHEWKSHRIIGKGFDFRCMHCDKPYRSKDGLNRHMQLDHDKELARGGRFECSICARRFVWKYAMERHIQTHGLERPFKCSICSNTFKHHNAKVKHERVVHKGDAPYQCFHCNKRFGTKSSLTEHIYSNHFLGVSKPFKCAVCDKSYAINSQLKQHELNHQPPQFKCAVCAKEFFRKKILKNHTSIHVSERRLFECSVCHKNFKDLYAERKHQRIVHKRDAPFQCAHCDKRCGQKAGLISHIHFRHFSLVAKQFKCPICDKSFSWKHNLKTHQLVHGTQKLFKCSVCDLSFKYPAVKTRHEWKSHRIGKRFDFRCMQCDKPYRNKEWLNRHMQEKHVE